MIYLNSDVIMTNKIVTFIIKMACFIFPVVIFWLEGDELKRTILLNSMLVDFSSN